MQNTAINIIDIWQRRLSIPEITCLTTCDAREAAQAGRGAGGKRKQPSSRALPPKRPILSKLCPFIINYPQYYLQVASVGSDSGPFPGTLFWMARGQGRPAEFAENREWERGKAIYVYKRAPGPTPLTHDFPHTQK